MVSKIISYIGREISGLHQAAYMLAFFTFLSQLLAFVRGRLLAGEFGAGAELDVFYAAFRVPDFMFVLLSAFVSIAILVPYLIKTQTDNPGETKPLINSVFTIFCVSSAIILGFVALIAPHLAELLFPKIVAGDLGVEFILLMRIMLISPFVLGVSSLLGSVLQSEKRFVFYALAPVFYNAGIIIGIMYFYPVWGLGGLAWGVVLGSLLHLLIQVPAVIKADYLPKFTLRFKGKAIREMLTLALPRTLTYASDQFNVSLLLAIAGLMTVGSVSVFSFALMLQAVPLALIGSSYALAAFPTLSKLHAHGKNQEFVKHFISASSHIIFWSLPAIALMIVLRAQVVRVIFGTGEFTWTDTRLTAASLAIFAVTIVIQGLNLLFVRGFYAAGKTWRPFLAHMVATAVVAGSALGYLYLFENTSYFSNFLEVLLKVESLPGTLVIILPLAYVTGAIVNCILLWSAFERNFHSFADKLWQVMFHSLGAACIMGFVAYWGLVLLEPLAAQETVIGVFLQGLGAGILGIIAWMVTLVLLKNKELDAVLQTIRMRVWKVKPVVEPRLDLE